MIRLLALAMLASLALLMPGHARAVEPCRAAVECDQGKAYAAAMAYSQRQAAARPGYAACVLPSGPTVFVGGITGAECVNYRQTAVESFYYQGSCSARPYELGWQGGETAATVNTCHNGCMYTSSLDPEGAAGVGFFPTGGTCTESDAPAPTPAGDGGDPGEGGGVVTAAVVIRAAAMVVATTAAVTAMAVETTPAAVMAAAAGETAMATEMGTVTVMGTAVGTAVVPARGQVPVRATEMAPARSVAMAAPCTSGTRT